MNSPRHLTFWASDDPAQKASCATSESALYKVFEQELRHQRSLSKTSPMIRWLFRHSSTLTFISLVVAGIGLHYYPENWPPEWSWLRSVLRPLSDALMVAGILGATVDWFLKRALIRDVGSIFIGWALPQEVRTYIREVSQTDIVLRNCQIRYILRLEGDNIIADVSKSWEVYNFSTGLKTYTSHMQIDMHEQPDHSAIRCEWSYGGTSRVLDSTSLNSGHKEQTTTSVKWAIPSVSLWPQDVNAPNLEPGCRVRWEYRLTMPKHYSTIHAFAAPVIDMTVTAEWPQELAFECDEHQALQHAPGSRTWFYRRLFMPQQHIRVRWNPKDGAA